VTDPAFIFTDDERANLQAAVAQSMVDICVIHTREETQSASGEVLPTYVDSDPTPCRYYALRSRFTAGPEFILVDIDARCVLPAGTAVSSRDLITITHRLGALLATPLQYDVHGDPTPGIMSTEVALAEHHL
jgi:hypothetical protein